MGIDLATKPGTYRMSPSGTLRVLPKQFPVRRLTVSPEFVNPPPAAMAQIAEDNKKTSAIWRRVTPRKWSGAFLLPVDDTATTLTSDTRVFMSPELPRDKTFYYTFKGEVIRNGEKVTATKLVQIRGGESAQGPGHRLRTSARRSGR